MVDQVVGGLAFSRSRSGLWKWVLIHRVTLFDVAFVLAASVLYVFDAALAEHPPSIPWWVPMAIGGPAGLLLTLRRRLPWTVLFVLVATTVGLTALHLSIGALNLVIQVAVYSVCVRSTPPMMVAAAGLAMCYPVADAVAYGMGPLMGALRVVGAVVNLVIVVGLAYAVQIGRRRAEQLERTLTMLDDARDQLAADAASIERARIAREFHDIVSHNLSVVALRAGVARAVIDRDPDHARQTLQELESSSRGALGEMRDMLTALRERDATGKETIDWQPTPTLDGLDDLVDSVRGGHVSWKLDRRGQVRELGPGVEMTAYRIVQEAMTNVLKHAGAGRARVLVEYGATTLRIEVTNELSALDEQVQRPGSQPSGHGLIGLRERVALLGGTLTAHPVMNGFRLEAVLPCPENPDLA
ncbi:sensor histidine kinase [Saccharopolyspora rhizosphaerae]|uniref:histidine kinase n=1 Tax=Saccharopolyspora rhizosphaerae TaxID=2492662 RepID=A0A3R8P1U8_9PSEU|nr:histidine kinase [Saccharopolyspora rhizosphaerae]RRO14769.1 sensor histidine kinase [Saccharopolyspora rhizosphaerae]